ncbi:MAG: hypothetical protein IPM85_17630 [Chitinophagaceae bacterium]|jgi:hypothetical protein|nr:hypothetical protein [Chitinophagaceae bacterium]
MKHLFFLVIAGFLAFTVSAQPGGGGFQRQTPEQRVAAIHAKLDSAFKLPAEDLAKIDTALTVLYTKQDERMKEIFASGERPDRETMIAERKKYSDAREEILKAILTEEQYGIWKDKIEPSMRPQRPMGGGGQGGGNN